MSAATPASTPRQTWDQRRAADAWQRITGLKNAGGADPREYARAAKQTSTRILTAGLGQALAFLLAKAAGKPKSPPRRLYDDLSAWVLAGRGVTARGEHLLDSILNGDSVFLRRATDETLAYLGWLTRFAEAEGLYEDNQNTGGSDDAR